MSDQVTFHAEKPTLTQHPVVGGDALAFPISPPPPRWWWIAMRQHAHTSPLLIRPWDQEADNRFVIECPTLADLEQVIGAVDQAVAQSNADYERELSQQQADQAQATRDRDQHDHERTNLQQAIAEHYAAAAATAP